MQTMAPRLLRRLGVDVAHFTNGMVLAMSVPTVVTIHDMSLTMFPSPPRRVLLNRHWSMWRLGAPDAIITVSESAKRDIVRCTAHRPSGST